MSSSQKPSAHKLRLAFMGTPQFAVPALLNLSDSFDVVAVYCQAPKPAGRGHHLQKSPVQMAAEAKGIAIRTPKTLRQAEEQAFFKGLNLDVAVVAAYGLILPEPILKAPRLGCLNIHASLLPRWRGAAPIHRAIVAGDRESGITIMRMEAGLDTGPMLLQDKCPIDATTTAEELHDKLSLMGASLVVRALDALSENKLPDRPQPSEGVTYAAKLTREEAAIDWTKTARELDQQIRGFYPWPGAYFKFQGETIKILRAEIIKTSSNQQQLPGTLIDNQLTIACGEGALRLLEVQKPSKKPIDGAAFLRGYKISPGQLL